AATVRHIRVPLGVAWLTTVLGCVTLAFNAIPAIRDFGIWSAFGITAIFLVSLVFIPAMLLLLPATGREPPGERVDSAFAYWLGRLGEFAVRERRIVLPITALLCAAALVGATQIRLETNYLEFFDEAGRERRDNARIAAAI